MAVGHNNQGGNSTFLSVRTSTDDKGRKKSVIAKRCTKDEPGAKLITKADGMPALDKDGNHTYRLEYDFIEGRIRGLEKRVTEFGKYLDIHIQDDRTYILSLERGDRYWSDFLQRLLNVDLGKTVRLTPYSIEENGKYNQGISMRQDGMKINRRWTKENNYEGGPPQAEQKEVNEEMVWDFGKRNSWLEANVLDVCSARIGNAVPAAITAPVSDSVADVDDDDLAF